MQRWALYEFYLGTKQCSLHRGSSSSTSNCLIPDCQYAEEEEGNVEEEVAVFL